MNALVGFDRLAVSARQAFRRKNDLPQVVTVTKEEIVAWDDLPSEIRREIVAWNDLPGEKRRAIQRAHQGIFISYRRQDSQHAAGRLHDYLCRHFPSENVFLDVDRIDPGTDFNSSIQDALASSKVLLALIGSQWSTVRDSRGRLRLEQPGDYVRAEIRSALNLPVKLLPILIDNAQMPDVDLLPDDIAKLAQTNAMFLRHETFSSDCKQILSWVQSILEA